MKSNIMSKTTNSFLTFTTPLPTSPSSFSRPASTPPPWRCLTFSRPCRLFPILCISSKPSSNDVSFSFQQSGSSNSSEEVVSLERNLSVQVGNPVLPSYVQSLTKLSLGDEAFLLLSFIACTTSIAFTSLVIAAVPTPYAMGRAATSLAKLADTAREELPSTMASIRLSGMEISYLTLELSDLSQEIADGVNKSAQAVQAAEAGIQQIGAMVRQHTVSMIQERANLPIISIQPVVAGAAKKTSRAVGNATKSFLNMISRGEFSPGNEDGTGIDGVEI